MVQKKKCYTEKWVNRSKKGRKTILKKNKNQQCSAHEFQTIKDQSCYHTETSQLNLQSKSIDWIYMMAILTFYKLILEEEKAINTQGKMDNSNKEGIFSEIINLETMIIEK